MHGDDQGRLRRHDGGLRRRGRAGLQPRDPGELQLRQRLRRAHPPHARSRSTASRRSPSRRRAPSARRARLQRPARATPPGSTTRARRRASTRISFLDVYKNRFDPAAGARQDRRRRRHGAGRSGPAPDLDERRGADARPRDPGQRDRHGPRGLPAARTRRGGSTRCCSSRSALLTPLAALRLRIFPALAIGVARAGRASSSPPRSRSTHGTMLTVVYPALAGHPRPAGHRRSSTASPWPSSASRRATPSRASCPRPSSTRCCAAPTASASGGVQREGTVMFSDLRGFTSFAETLEPATVIGALNRYLTAMSEAILDHGGTLVAYMGDGIMAVFGAPLAQDDHADRALAAVARHARPPRGLQRVAARGGPARGLQDGHRPQQRPGDVRPRRLRAPAGVHGARRHDEHRRAPGGHDQGHALPALRGRLDPQPPQPSSAEDLVEVGEFEVRGRTATVKLWSLRESEAPAGAAGGAPASAAVETSP